MLLGPGASDDLQSNPKGVPPARCTGCGARCDVSPVRTQMMVTLNVAQKWAVGTECNG